MKVSQEYKESARRKILEAAGRGFRKNGYGGLCVDGLAKEAGVTSGAFYSHFKSKDEAFAAATIQGLIDYREGVKKFQADHGAKWIKHFLDYYLGDKHRDDVANGCAVPGLSADVMRADSATRKDYETHLHEIAEAIADGLPERNLGTAHALMALLTGSLLMERAVTDPKAAKAIAKATRKVAEKLAILSLGS